MNINRTLVFILIFFASVYHNVYAVGDSINSWKCRVAAFQINTLSNNQTQILNYPSKTQDYLGNEVKYIPTLAVQSRNYNVPKTPFPGFGLALGFSRRTGTNGSFSIGGRVSKMNLTMDTENVFFADSYGKQEYGLEVVDGRYVVTNTTVFFQLLTTLMPNKKFSQRFGIGLAVNGVYMSNYQLYTRYTYQVSDRSQEGYFEEVDLKMKDKAFSIYPEIYYQIQLKRFSKRTAWLQFSYITNLNYLSQNKRGLLKQNDYQIDALMIGLCIDFHSDGN